MRFIFSGLRTREIAVDHKIAMRDINLPEDELVEIFLHNIAK